MTVPQRNPQQRKSEISGIRVEPSYLAFPLLSRVLQPMAAKLAELGKSDSDDDETVR